MKRKERLEEKRGEMKVKLREEGSPRLYVHLFV